MVDKRLGKGLRALIPDIPLEEDLGLIGFAVSAVLLFGVSFFDRKRSSSRVTE